MARRSLALAGLIVSLVAGACGSSHFRYVTSKKTGTYFKVPAEWKVFDQKTLVDAVKASGGNASPNLLFASAFDASSKPTLTNVFPQADPPPSQPTGIARVFALSDADRDAVSLQALRNMLVDVDGGVSAQKVNVLGLTDLAPPGGLHGQRIIYEVQGDNGKFIVDQSTLLDDKARQVWVFAVGCQSACYTSQRSKIDKVVSSWTVKKR